MPFNTVFDAEDSASVLADVLQDWADSAQPLFEACGLARLSGAECDHALVGYRLPVQGPCPMTLAFTLVRLNSPKGESCAFAWVLECADERCGDALGLSLEFNPIYATSNALAMPLEPARDAVSAQVPAQVLDWAATTLESYGVRHTLSVPG